MHKHGPSTRKLCNAMRLQGPKGINRDVEGHVKATMTGKMGIRPPHSASEVATLRGPHDR